MSRAQVSENKYPAKCDECGDQVNALAGCLIRDKDGSFFVRCIWCQNKISTRHKFNEVTARNLKKKDASN